MDAIPKSRYLTYLAVALTGIAADLWTKTAVFSWLGKPLRGVDNTWWLLEPFIGIQTAVNQGALFGLGQGMSHFFAALSLVAFAGIFLWLFRFGAAHDRFLTVILGMITAGIFGNLYDRLGMWHSNEIEEYLRNGVRDWILLQYPAIGTWPNFNIADSLLVCGAASLVFHAFWYDESKQTTHLQADKK